MKVKDKIIKKSDKLSHSSSKLRKAWINEATSKRSSQKICLVFFQISPDKQLAEMYKDYTTGNFDF